MSDTFFLRLMVACCGVAALTTALALSVTVLEALGLAAIWMGWR